MTPALAAATVAVAAMVLALHGVIALTLARCREAHPLGARYADLNAHRAEAGALTAFAYLVIGAVGSAGVALPSWVPHSAGSVAAFALVQLTWTLYSVLDLLELRPAPAPGRDA